MAEYTPPLDEIRFVLEHVAGIDELSKLEGFEHADLDSTMTVLEEYGRFVVDKVLPTNREGDEVGSHVGGDPADPTVVTPEGFKAAYAQYVESGWGSVPFPPAYGGGGFPWTVGIAMQELLNSGNLAFAIAPLLTQGALDMLFTHGSEEQKERYLPKMVTGEWSGTMNLTEPEAGSDVGAVRTRAMPAGDGTYRITGTKIFISYGEHDLAENIIHLVLARTPDAPPGTKGISCFIVPKLLLEDDGSLGRRNGVKVVSVEHKMGIKASPTCVLEYDDAVGYLVGDENAGMRYMFTMMNNARLSVGIEGLGLCEAAWQRALQYAKERKQGQPVDAPGSTIVEHADVRRMLMTMKASTEALRALHYFDARQIDLGHNHPDSAGRTAATELAGLLTPLSKGWGTDLANEVTSLAIQVFGGMGYVEETGVAQLYRDARITAIYEGTNGIQAMDLVGRKLPMRGGAVVADLVSRMRATAAELQGAGPELAPIGVQLADGLDVLGQATDWILANGAADPVQALSAATPYLRMFSQVVGAWLLGIEALAATRAASLPAGFAEAKVATARFFADHILPTGHGLLPTIQAGKTDLFAIPADQL